MACDGSQVSGCMRDRRHAWGAKGSAPAVALSPLCLSSFCFVLVTALSSWSWPFYWYSRIVLYFSSVYGSLWLYHALSHEQYSLLLWCSVASSSRTECTLKNTLIRKLLRRISLCERGLSVPVQLQVLLIYCMVLPWWSHAIWHNWNGKHCAQEGIWWYIMHMNRTVTARYLPWHDFDQWKHHETFIRRFEICAAIFGARLDNFTVQRNSDGCDG